jgi:hypothetical protein
MIGRRFSAPPPRPDVLDRDLRLRDERPQWTMGFVGDVCPLFGRDVQFGAGVRDFFADCDVVVGNFEGIFTERRWKPFLMKHRPDILDGMAVLRPLERWVVSVANNHATDFGTEALRRTLRVLERRGVRWVGTTDRPRLRLADDVTLTAWTWWLNRRADGVVRRDPGAPPTPGLHVALPHWGYEHERTPRASQTVPEGYALTAGHHPHLPQPFEQRPNGQLVAWSLGNFVTGKQLSVLGEGALLRVGVARPHDGPAEIVRAHFRELDLDRDCTRCRVTLRHPSSVPVPGRSRSKGAAARSRPEVAAARS